MRIFVAFVLVLYLAAPAFAQIASTVNTNIYVLTHAYGAFASGLKSGGNTETVDIRNNQSSNGFMKKIFGKRSCFKRWKLDTAVLSIAKSCKIQKMKFIKWLRSSNSSDVNAIRIAYKGCVLLVSLIY